MAGTSPIAASLPVSGLQLAVGTSGSPDSFQVIANVEDWSMASKSTVVMTTNVSDTYVRRQPTLLDPGAPSFKIFYLPDEVTHRNAADSGTVTAGLRYLWINKLLRDWQVRYPADANGNTPVDAFKAYVTDFGITGKVGGVFEAQISLGISDSAPSLA